MLDDETRNKLEQAKAKAPKTRAPKVPTKTTEAEQSPQTDPETPRRVMPYPRPEECPDVASVVANLKGSVLLYTSRPWSSERSLLSGKAHLWWLALPSHHEADFRKLTEQGAVIWHCQPVAAEPKQAGAVSGRVFAQHAKWKTPPRIPPHLRGVLLVVGWLEV